MLFKSITICFASATQRHHNNTSLYISLGFSLLFKWAADEKLNADPVPLVVQDLNSRGQSENDSRLQHDLTPPWGFHSEWRGEEAGALKSVSLTEDPSWRVAVWTSFTGIRSNRWPVSRILLQETVWCQGVGRGITRNIRSDHLHLQFHSINQIRWCETRLDWTRFNFIAIVYTYKYIVLMSTLKDKWSSFLPQFCIMHSEYDHIRTPLKEALNKRM